MCIIFACGEQKELYIRTKKLKTFLIVRILKYFSLMKFFLDGI